MAEHRVAISFLILGQIGWALLGAEYLGVLPTKTSFVVYPALPGFQPFSVFEGLCTALLEFWLVGLFLKSMSLTPTRRAYVVSCLVSVALALLTAVLAFGAKFAAPLGEDPFAAVAIFLAAIFIGFWVINRLMCFICQILVDGTPSLSRSLQGVAGRLAHVWLTLILVIITMFCIVWLFELVADTLSLSSGDLSVWVSHGLDALVLGLVLGFGVLMAALSVVWFLSPIQRPPEESTTWVVPEGSLQR